ncbi:putative 3'-5' exonuclease related to the exonuclease domain of PolB family protein [Neorickettsia helminthoeca str. Oregon]|uniref:Putative 3'-5' exonuclease related to the exonuclease domain of PolB family protein n=1 Tax=Neorickettsia helminthoeca str. Oregon TaxID=1286528 RepID=X5HME1_9RICK|nr:3'-5' exonuclease [Neorickettsia helminthoeca]AHX11630.1 putative 3'-5' exonuclease related to the exonuclease domain of PolB family protein [Neorickettsia helminthoeca str. Oregon]
MDSVVVFDVETIPDTDLCAALTGCKSDNLDEMRSAMEDYHLRITDGKNPFLRQPFHKVIVVSLLKATLAVKNGYEFLELKKIASGDIESYAEKELVQFFFDHVCKSLPRLVSYNGRAFDLSVLKYKAMRYGIVARDFYYSGDKWSNYNNRYSADWHTDLIEVLSDYGSSARMKMSELCVAFGLPGKLGIDGANVVSMYDQGKINEIKYYCEIDVLNTYMIYLIMLRHQGRISSDSYTRNLNELQFYLNENLDKNPSYREFLQLLDRSPVLHFK